MDKIKPTMRNIVLSLTTICLIAGVALATANRYTANTIAATRAAELYNAIKNVTPAFDNNPGEDFFKIGITGSDSLTVYPAKIEGKPVGYAIESYSKEGFCGLIRVLVGLDADGKLYNYSVLEQNETPGLGTKMEEWFRQDKNRQNIIGRDMKKGSLKLSKDGGDIDAITAATISSRAFLEAINLAYSAFLNNSDAIDRITNE